ncbi:MAG: ion transporter [Alphaproteobacteria bacterium]
MSDLSAASRLPPGPLPPGNDNAPTNWRTRLADVAESTPVQRFVTALIVINAITLGLETSATAMEFAGPLLVAIDKAVLAVFVVELLAKLIGRGARFFRNGWNVFDFIVVGIALAPATGALSVLRALRILRVLRLLSVVPQMRQVVESLLRAVPGLGSIAAILMLIFYVFAVLATKLFGASFDEWFGSVGASMYSLFQIMTLESWSMGIVRPVMEVYPAAWMFFVPFILIATFTMLNLFIAIIVSAMQSQHEEEQKAELAAIQQASDDETAILTAEIAAVRRDISDMRAELKALIEKR